MGNLRRDWIVKLKELCIKDGELMRGLHGISDAGTRLLFKFRSGTHGLNEELGSYRSREGKSACMFCSAECGNVVHVL